MIRYIFAFSLITIIPFPLAASQTVSSGTGFFLNRMGYIITNEHVVKNCKTITVNNSYVNTPSALIKTDKINDIALLKIDSKQSDFLKLRKQAVIKDNEEAVMIGYPLQKSISGAYSINKTNVIKMEGPMGEKGWIQFSAAAKKGNSGGPLLDIYGNVIGIVMGKVQYFKLGYDNDNKAVKFSDIAISSVVLKKFLDKNNIPYTASGSLTKKLSDSELENKAKNYIVRVNCFLR